MLKSSFVQSLIAFVLLTSISGAATIQLPKTGQVSSFANGDDGSKRKGAAWPDPRFSDNSNGTITDNLTGLTWLKNANCTDTVGSIAKGANGSLSSWYDALTWSNSLADGSCGLTDGSIAGQWRLPNRKELLSLMDHSVSNPSLPPGHPFQNVKSSYYFSSNSLNNNNSWYVDMGTGYVSMLQKVSFNYYVWPVRGGQ